MSNIGYQWLFGILRGHQHLLVERFFDLHRREPVSIEGSRPLREFPIIAVSIPFELDIFNFLNMLSAAGIPLRAKDRENGPLIVAGGDAMTLDPFPFADFFDIIVLGCGEAWANSFPKILRELPSGLASKESILDEAAKIPGTWIPSRDDGGSIYKSPSTRTSPAYTPILSSFGHFRNMFLVEVQRGCAFRCGFCSSNWLDRPFFNYDADQIMDSYRRFGQSAKRVGLVGSAIAEHPDLEDIIRRFAEKDIRISPSSIRFDRISNSVLESLVRSGTRMLTFAPETASERLARRIGKWIPPGKIIEYASTMEKIGLRELKLYWIVGLPGETLDDVRADVRAIDEIVSATSMQIRCSVNAFIPKPHTTFEHEAMLSRRELSARFSIFEKSLGKKGNLRLEFNHSRRSRISALLSTSGRDISPILIDIVAGKGIKSAFREYGIDIDAPIAAKPPFEWERIFGG